MIKTDLWTGYVIARSATQDDIQLAEKWRDNALYDGFRVIETMSNDKMALIQHLEKEGYKLQILITKKTRLLFKLNGTDSVGISLYAPDMLAVTVPNEYNWQDIKTLSRTCMECGRVGKTDRLGIAGRGCLECVNLYQKGVLV